MNKRTRIPRPATAEAVSSAHREASPMLSAAAMKAMRSEDVRAIQSVAGNRAARSAAQRTMSVGAAGDALEVEADAVAREVVNHTQRESIEEEELQASHLQRAATEEEELQMSRLQRAATEEEELQASHLQRAATEEEELQASHLQRAATAEEELQMSRLQRDAAPEVGMEGGAPSAETSAAIESARGGGSPLPDGVRREMEGAFGADFGNVRVHQGAESADLNQRLAARAFTTGNDIFIGQGGLNAGSRGGKELLAHELTHVVQQGAARKTRRKS